MDQLKVESGLSIQFLKLTPNFSDSEISHIFLGININNNNIYKVIEVGKNNSKKKIHVIVKVAENRILMKTTYSNAQLNLRKIL